MSDKKHLVKKSLYIAGHATSVALERAFWQVLARMGEEKGKTISEIVTEIDFKRPNAHPLTSALRVAVVQYLAQGAQNDTHKGA